MHAPKEANLHTSSSQCPTHKTRQCCTEPSHLKYTNRSTSYCSVLRMGLLSKATQNAPFSMARNREIVIQYYGSVPSCQENIKGNTEIQKDANSSQLTLASSFKQAIGWLHKSSLLCFLTHRNRQFKRTFNVHSTKDFIRISKLLILLLNPVTYRLGI